MAITRMVKVLVVTHQSQVAELLEALQTEGILQVLDSSEAAVAKQWPELQVQLQRPKQLEETLGRLEKSLAFLKQYSSGKKALADILAPRPVVENKLYSQVVSGRQVLELSRRCEETDAKIAGLRGKYADYEQKLQMLRPWSELGTPVEQISELDRASCLTGLVQNQYAERVAVQLAELDAAIQQLGQADSRQAWVVVCVNEQLNDVQKVLRSADFEPVSFEGMTGTVAEVMNEYEAGMAEIARQLDVETQEAARLSEGRLELQILLDHYQNLLAREQVRIAAPATEQAVFLEGWVRRKDYTRLENLVGQSAACSVAAIEPAEDEQIPVEIENNRLIEPFEVITRLYGMPQHFSVDPTVFLAPFFALFFGICLGDGGYGFTMMIVLAFLIRKIQGDKKLFWMLWICSLGAVLVGALTGGWFGDGVQQFAPSLNRLRGKMMWFDPLEKPQIFFALALILGYFQIITGLTIALGHSLARKDYVGAVCDQLSWLVMLNSVVIFGMSKAGRVPEEIGRFFGLVVPVPAAVILLFSCRDGGWGGRVGMGAYNLFSSVFYLGDVLSYVRLMGLGLVGTGMAMAVNIIAKITLKIPYGIGIILTIPVLVGGHGFNLILSALGAFVHTMRLQYVEFFPKFLASGGRPFEPLCRRYKHIYIGKF